MERAKEPCLVCALTRILGAAQAPEVIEDLSGGVLLYKSESEPGLRFVVATAGFGSDDQGRVLTVMTKGQRPPRGHGGHRGPASTGERRSRKRADRQKPRSRDWIRYAREADYHAADL